MFPPYACIWILSPLIKRRGSIWSASWFSGKILSLDFNYSEVKGFAEYVNVKILLLESIGWKWRSQLIMIFGSFLIQLPLLPPDIQSWGEFILKLAPEFRSPLLMCSFPSKMVSRAARHILIYYKLVVLPALVMRILNSLK